MTENKENNVSSSEKRVESGEEEQALTEHELSPASQIESFLASPSFDEHEVDSYAKAIHKLVEGNPSLQAAKQALDAHREIVAKLKNARELLDAIASTRVEKARIERGQSSFPQDIVSLSKVVQVEQQRRENEQAALQQARQELTSDRPKASENDVTLVQQEPSLPAQRSRSGILRRIFGRFFK